MKENTKEIKIIKWMKPSQDSFVLNTDRYSKGNPEHSGGGGVLRDCQGNVVLVFSCYLVQLNSIQA